MPKTRLAPSPTGALHLGNARTFLINWLLARQNGWEILLRIEDLDGPRIKAGADAMLLQDLKWLGLDWDSGPTYQSARQEVYKIAVNHLLETHHAYPCICSRREVDLAARAPHAEDGAAVYPGTCRGKFPTMEAARESGKSPAVRFAVPESRTRKIEFDDGFLGHQQFNPKKDLGDFVIAKSDGTAAYQLAVVLDDIEAGITEIVRGDDLLDSTPRQILLYHALDHARDIPRYTHVPLVVGEDGLRLAKRHGDSRIAFYRESGVPAGKILALLARWCNIDTNNEEIPTPQSLRGRFDLSNLSPSPITFTQSDDRKLRNLA
jgi:glutamyl-tRNA synthetase